jgi:tRNA threonylcarbamoyladenosine biosynthesis protein TsaB
MRFLAIETSTQHLGVALIQDERLLGAASLLLPEHPHAAQMPGMVDRVLSSTRTGWSQLTAIIVNIGPGSFTGLRIGVAFAKALSFARKLPVVGVPSLDVLAAQVPFAPQPVCPLLDAKRKNVYGAIYRIENLQLRKQTDYILGTPEEVLAKLSGPAIFLGDACTLYRERILQLQPDSVILPEDFWWPQPATLARLGRDRFLAGQKDDPAALAPLYLYPLNCSVRTPLHPAVAA